MIVIYNYIVIYIPTHRAPTHPGEMLLEEFLNPMSLTQRELADAIHVPYQRVNDLVHGRRGKYFNTSPDFWMNLQLRWDLYFALQKETGLLDRIHPYQTSAS